MHMLFYEKLLNCAAGLRTDTTGIHSYYALFSGSPMLESQVG